MRNRVSAKRGPFWLPRLWSLVHCYQSTSILTVMKPHRPAKNRAMRVAPVLAALTVTCASADLRPRKPGDAAGTGNSADLVVVAADNTPLILHVSCGAIASGAGEVAGRATLPDGSRRALRVDTGRTGRLSLDGPDGAAEGSSSVLGDAAQARISAACAGEEAWPDCVLWGDNAFNTRGVHNLSCVHERHLRAYGPAYLPYERLDEGAHTTPREGLSRQGHGERFGQQGQRRVPLAEVAGCPAPHCATCQHGRASGEDGRGCRVPRRADVASRRGGGHPTGESRRLRPRPRNMCAAKAQRLEPRLERRQLSADRRRRQSCSLRFVRRAAAPRALHVLGGWPAVRRDGSASARASGGWRPSFAGAGRGVTAVVRRYISDIARISVCASASKFPYRNPTLRARTAVAPPPPPPAPPAPHTRPTHPDPSTQRSRAARRAPPSLSEL